MKKNKYKYIFIAIVAVTILIFLDIYDTYREKSLDNLLDYKKNEPVTFGFTKNREMVPDNSGFEWVTDEEEPVEELLQFLGQYRVKKVSEDSFNEELSSGESFEFYIHQDKGDPILVMVLENGIHLYVGHYYEFVNGPIDMKWIRQFNEKYRKSLRELK